MTVTVRLHTVAAFALGLVMAIVGTHVFQAWRVDAAPGDADATFVPITACRLADTRPPPTRVGSAATFTGDVTARLQAHGTNGNCTIPASATGLALNVTAVNASRPTFLTIWPDGDRPTASSLNPAPGQPPTPNAVTTDLAPDGSFRVYNMQGTVDVILDVVGYYTAASLTHLSAELERIESLAHRLVGHTVAERLLEREAGGGGNPDFFPTALEIEIDVCEAPNTGCFTLTAGPFDNDDDLEVVRFSGASTSDFPTIAELLTNGIDNHLVFRTFFIRPGGGRDPSTISTSAESRFFRNGHVSSSLGHVDLAGLDIGSISVVADRVAFSSTPSTYYYAYSARVVFELAGAPPVAG